MIRFGTGGWRAIIADGFTKENIRLLTAGLCNLMIRDGHSGKEICLGYDRRFLSKESMFWAAEVLAGYGFRPFVINRSVPTPMVMFTVKQKGLPYGMAITASHNPAIYNGIKIFTAGGRDADQSVTKKIETEIEKLTPSDVKSIPYEEALHSGIIREGYPFNEYIDSILNLVDVQKIKDTALSATTLQNYLACPAKFYYSTVKGLRAEEEVAESLDYGMFGTIFHETMRSLYAGECVSTEYLKSWLSRESEIRELVKSLIMREMNVMEVTGRNLVVADVIVKYVKKTLSCDIDVLRENGVSHFEIYGLENQFTRTVFGQKFKGYIDRLDSMKDGEIRVVDYKTGKVLENDENIDDLNAVDIAQMIFDPQCKERPKIALQFFIYDMLIQGDPRVKDLKIFNSVYSTANLFKDNPKTKSLCQKFYDTMIDHLEKLLEEIYDLDVPFRRTEDEKVCSYCDFKMICGR